MTEEEWEVSVMGVNIAKDIEDFHHKFDLRYDGDPRALPGGMATFRQGFLSEELREYMQASLNVNEAIRAKDDGEITFFLEQQLDALVDLVYVAVGTSYLHGFDFNVAWHRVHRANMAKVRASDASQSKRASPLDVVKPEDWQPPSHKDMVEAHAHKQGKLDL